MFFGLAAACLCNPVETLLFRSGDAGSKYYRIPAIVTAKDGSLVTATDKRWNHQGDLPAKIYVVVRRSTDGGATWSDTLTIAADDTTGFGDASLVVDKATGTIMCLFNGNNGIWQSTSDNPQRHYYCLSTDNGQSWTSPTDFTNQIYGKGCSDPERASWKGMFISSGATLQLRDGRIMAVGVVQKKAGEALMNHPLYTDDLGKTWHVGGLACNAGDESKVVELNNGSVLMSIRHAPNRYFAISNDRGESWQNYWSHPDVRDPACDGDIIRYTSTLDGYNKDRLIHTIPYSGSRSNVSVLISYDEGNTWPVKKTIHADSSAYSSAAVLPDGKIAVYYERGWSDGYDMVVSVMTLDWVSDGKDTWTPST